LSVAVFTHSPEQREEPASQVVEQPPLEQVAVPLGVLGQTVPHAPQLLRSLLVSTQESPHWMKGVLHWNPQPPPAHTGVALLGAVHTMPHRPQLELSLPVSTHEPPQLVSAPQLFVQTPDMQTVPEPQTVPQAPQCCALDCVSTHAPAHCV